MIGVRIAPVIEALVLSAWLGAALLVAAVVAPAAFEVLPSRALAGALVGRVLPVIFYAGIVAGGATAALEIWANTGGPHRGRIILGVVTAVSCALAQFLVAPRIAAIRDAVSGPIDALAADDSRRIAFGRLHAYSVGWLALAMVAALAVLVLAIRSQAAPGSTRTP
jgi:hypothetical protein